MVNDGREYTDGQYNFELVVIDEVGYLVKMENILTNYQCKQYFTKDSETAIVLFESLVECFEREGEDAALHFDYRDRLAYGFNNRVEVNIE